jgi:hypothetical protein
MGHRVIPVLFLLSYLFWSGGEDSAFAQTSSSSAPDTAAADTTVTEESTGSFFSIGNMTRMVSDLVYVKDSEADSLKFEVVKSENAFLPYSGRVIRNIRIKQIGPFTGMTGDPTSQSKAVRTLNSLHINTRQNVIRGYFLMDEGDPVDPFAISDTERLLRDARFIDDVRIEVVPVSGTADSVDLLVLTRDIWSLGGTIDIKTSTRYSFSVFDRNFLGLGHNFDNTFDINTEKEQSFGYIGTYDLPNIKGSYVASRVQYKNTWEEEFGFFRLNRDFLAPQIRVGGQLEILSVDKQEKDDNEAFNKQDVGVGHSTPLGSNVAGGEGRTQFVASGRAINTDFTRTPVPVSEGTNRKWHDDTFLLGSLSLTRNDVSEGRLIFGYGRVENVPRGYLASLIGGYEFSEFDNRVYAGVDLGAGGYKSFGYLSTKLQIGGFLRDEKIEDGAVQLHPGYFSELINTGRYGFRQFADVGYTLGLGREEGDTIILDDDKGIRGLKNSGLTGKERLFLNLETISYTPWNLFGWKVTLFGFWDVGTIGPDFGSFLTGKYYSSIGLGLRIKNERLVFSGLELRLAYFPVEPDGADLEYFDSGGVPRLRLPDYNARLPSEVPY